MADATGREAFRNLATIFKNRDRYKKKWDAIVGNLDAFADDIKGAATAHPRGTMPSTKARRPG